MVISRPVFFLLMAAVFAAAFFLRERKRWPYYRDALQVKGIILEKNRSMGHMNKTTVRVAYQVGKKCFERYFPCSTINALALGEEIELLVPKGKPGNAYPKAQITRYRIHSMLILVIGLLFLLMALRAQFKGSL